jgi:hypothetical protein
MPPRTRKRPTSPTESKVRFVTVPTAALIKLEVDDGRDVTGAFVRLSPRLRRSERAAFDVSAAERGLYDRGAIVAVAAPVMIPDTQETKRSAKQAAASVDARAELSAWFGDEPSDEAAEALRGCLAILDEVGL